MATKRHRPLTDTEIAKLLMVAQNYRRRFVSHGDPFNVVTHIERELSFNQEFTFDIVDVLETDGVPNDARVTFSDGVLLEITEETYIRAVNGNGTDRFTLAHEISHIFFAGLPEKCPRTEATRKAKITGLRRLTLLGSDVPVGNTP